jgi:hypothetical protein
MSFKTRDILRNFKEIASHFAQDKCVHKSVALSRNAQAHLLVSSGTHSADTASRHCTQDIDSGHLHNADSMFFAGLDFLLFSLCSCETPRPQHGAVSGAKSARCKLRASRRGPLSLLHHHHLVIAFCDESEAWHPSQHPSQHSRQKS